MQKYFQMTMICQAFNTNDLFGGASSSLGLFDVTFEAKCFPCLVLQETQLGCQSCTLAY